MAESYNERKVFSNELIIGLSEKYKKTIAQIILRWHVQRGVIPIPNHQIKQNKENLNIFDFEISNECENYQFS